MAEETGFFIIITLGLVAFALRSNENGMQLGEWGAGGREPQEAPRDEPKPQPPPVEGTPQTGVGGSTSAQNQSSMTGLVQTQTAQIHGLGSNMMSGLAQNQSYGGGIYYG